MARHIVVALRMPPAGMAPERQPDGSPGAYLARARSMCAHGEALGGRLVAWSGAMLAMAWDCDSIEEALLLATSIRGESASPDRAWSGGMAEGELEPLAPDGARMQLAWGEVLLSAASLARIAKPGELLAEGDMTAVRSGQLTLLGSRAGTDAGQRVRGWRLDLEQPWRLVAEGAPQEANEAMLGGAQGSTVRTDTTDGYAVHTPADRSPEPDPDATQEMTAIDPMVEELAASDVLEVVDAPAHAGATALADVEPRPGRVLAERVCRLARAESHAAGPEAVETLAELRRARTWAADAPAASRCQVALALAMTLAIAGRAEDALLEAMEALARAREANDPKAVGACMALLAKLYSSAGFSREAATLRESSGI